MTEPQPDPIAALRGLLVKAELLPHGAWCAWKQSPFRQCDCGVGEFQTEFDACLAALPALPVPIQCPCGHSQAKHWIICDICPHACMQLCDIGAAPTPDRRRER